MSTSPHRIHHDLYRGPKLLADPGSGGIIRANADLQICEMVSATTETRTLANPTKPGIRLILRLLTDGGNVVVTAENGLNANLETEATFADAGDFLELISVTLSAGPPATYRWEDLSASGLTSGGVVVSSSSPSASASSSPSSSTSSSPSSSVSSSPSAT